MMIATLIEIFIAQKKNSSFTKINSKLNPHVPWLLNVLDVSKLFFPWILELLSNKDIHKVKLLFPFRENSLNLLILLSYSFVSIKPWVQRENRQKYLIYIYISCTKIAHCRVSFFIPRGVLFGHRRGIQTPICEIEKILAHETIVRLHFRIRVAFPFDRIPYTRRTSGLMDARNEYIK